MSIIRIGLAETKNFAEGYDAIFGKKKAPAKKPAAEASAVAETSPAAETSAAKKPAKKIAKKK